MKWQGRRKAVSSWAVRGITESTVEIVDRDAREAACKRRVLQLVKS